MGVKDTENRERYTVWLSTPLAEREIKSERKFAEHLGLSRTTLFRWKNDWRFASQVTERLGRHLDIGELPTVMESLLAQATDPLNNRSVQAARVIIDYVRWSLDRTENTDIDVRNLSDDELRDLMLEALNTIDERERTHKT